MKTIKKYWKIYRVLLSNSFSYIANYRNDAWLMLVMNTVSLLTTFVIVQVIFSQTNSIGGWTAGEVYLLLMVWTILDELGSVFFNYLFFLPEIINDGSVDFYITKPVSALFLISLKYFLWRAVLRILIDVVLFFVVISYFHLEFYWLNYLIFFILLPFSILVLYSIFLIANTLAFWFQRIDNINDTIRNYFSFARYPLEIFSTKTRWFFYSFFPLAFTSYIPVAILLKRLPIYWAAIMTVFSLTIFSLAILFWRYALKRYSSASS